MRQRILSLVILFRESVADWDHRNESAMIRWLSREAFRENLTGRYHLIFLDDDSIKALNREFLHEDLPTDVLSFNLVEKENYKLTLDWEVGENPMPDGEIYVSLQRAAEQAKDYIVSLTEEISRLALHGLLHLAGWRDEDRSSRAAMSKREDEGLNRGRTTEGNFPWLFSPPASV